MRLQDVSDGRVYATAGRTLYRERPGGGFERRGTVPLARRGLDGLRERVLTARPWTELVEPVVGAYPTVNCWALSGDRLLATAGTSAFASADGGQTWERTHVLPSSSPPMGVLPTSVCHHEGVTYLAEYPLDGQTAACVLRSTDFGRSWEAFLELTGVRHAHSVAVDPYDGDLWLTTGDADDESWILRVADGKAATPESSGAVPDGGGGVSDSAAAATATESAAMAAVGSRAVEVVGGGSQTWRAVELAFTHDAVLWGMDCAYAEEIQLFALSRSELDGPDPTPERVGTADSSVYYATTVEVEGTERVVCSTASEVGTDRTAPGDGSTADESATVITASAADGFAEWTTLASYDRRATLADRTGDPPRIPTSNAYVFLASDPDSGLYWSPFNTASGHGRIQRVAPAAFPS